jgi:hypothetical protein
MDSCDWSNGIRYHIFVTRPDTEFKDLIRTEFKPSGGWRQTQETRIGDYVEGRFEQSLGACPTGGDARLDGGVRTLGALEGHRVEELVRGLRVAAQVGFESKA